MIVLVDLDNTLVDRDRAFRTWAQHLVDELHADPGELDWLLAADGGGYTPRADLAAALKERWGLQVSVPDLVERLLFELVELIQAYPGVPAALEAVTTAGAAVVVVTNGTVAQQGRKLLHTGLASLITEAVVSEAVGSKKPDPLIFRTALEVAGRHGGRGPAWMVGDHPVADIAGAQACGLLTGWVSHGRAWSAGTPADLVSPSTSDLLQQIVPAPSR